MAIGSIQSGSAGLASTAPKTLNFSALYDPRDTNKDGIVSPAEDLAYSFKHPELAALKRLRTADATHTSSATSGLNQYTQKGALNASGKTTNSFLDVYI
jgi:hypothetical protein